MNAASPNADRDELLELLEDHISPHGHREILRAYVALKNCQGAGGGRGAAEASRVLAEKLRAAAAAADLLAALTS